MEARADHESVRNLELARMIADMEEVQAENDDIIALLAHELKSPLGTIRTIAGMLAGATDVPDSERRDYEREIHGIATRMFDVINATLASAEDRHKAVQAINDGFTVWNYMRSESLAAAKAKGIVLEWDMDEEACPIKATEQQLNLVLDNLVSNALKFSKKDGKVQVSIRRKKYGRGPDRVLIRVKDQGPGMSETDRDRLFTPFAPLTAQPTGDETSTGLGLHLVKKTVDHLSGRVWCESIEGKGATFFVELPLHGAADA